MMADPLDALSAREKEVFSLLMIGKQTKDIAELLEISPKTVDTYRASLMRKLNFPESPDDPYAVVGAPKKPRPPYRSARAAERLD